MVSRQRNRPADKRDQPGGHRGFPRHLERGGSAQALGPHGAKAQERARSERPIVGGRDAPRDFAREDRADNQAEAPVEQRGQHGGQRDQQHCALGRSRAHRQPHDHAVHGRGGGQDVAADDDHRHLERERDERPEPVTPRIDDLERRRPRGRIGRKGRNDDDRGGGQREDERVRHEALGPRGGPQREALDDVASFGFDGGLRKSVEDWRNSSRADKAAAESGWRPPAVRPVRTTLRADRIAGPASPVTRSTQCVSRVPPGLQVSREPRRVVAKWALRARRSEMRCKLHREGRDRAWGWGSPRDRRHVPAGAVCRRVEPGPTSDCPTRRAVAAARRQPPAALRSAVSRTGSRGTGSSPRGGTAPRPS